MDLPDSQVPHHERVPRVGPDAVNSIAQVEAIQAVAVGLVVVEPHERQRANVDDLVRAVVKTGQIDDEVQEKHLVDTLILRRDKIGRAYLPKINPIVDPVLSASGELTFGNAALQYGFAAAPAGYSATWARFDNATGTQETAGAEASVTEPRAQAPASLLASKPQFIAARIRAFHPDRPAWAQPLMMYFRQLDGGWKLVGLERNP